MNDPFYDQLREANWKRKMTSGEEAQLRAWLAAHPERESDWEAEAGLSDALNRLPDVEVPSNFTARVLSRVERMERDVAGCLPAGPKAKWTWRWLLPQAAFALLVLGVAWFFYERYQVARRAELARNVAMVSRVAAVPGPEFLQDFETIRRLDQISRPDEQLLALMK
jgi:hypothetical protein